MAGLPQRAWNAFVKKERSQTTDQGTASALKSRLFPEQLAALESDADFQVRLGGRRGGKSLCNETDLVATACEHPGLEMSLYITLTKHHSRRNLERQIEHDIKTLNIPMRRSEVDGQLYYTHQNGHAIWLTGCKDRAEADKLRGDKYRKVIVDESGSERFAAQDKDQTEMGEQRDLLQYLVTEVLSPALSDLNGKLALSGSPGVLPRGYLWQVSTGDGLLAQWPTYHWTVLDNPHHPYNPDHPKNDGRGGWRRFREEAIRAGCEVYTDQDLAAGAKGVFPGLPWLKRASAAFMREWLAKWVRDSEALCYNYVVGRNGFTDDDLPKDGQWLYVLGVDVGFKDQCTFVVTASRRNFPHVWILEAHGKSEMTPDSLAAEILRISSRYKLNRIVIDPGGGGKFEGEGIKKKYGLPIEMAKKQAKGAAIRELNGGLRAGTVRVHTSKASQLIAELMTITWNSDRTNHDDACIDDTADAAVYAYREHPTYERWDENPPAPGTPEAANRAMDLEVERRQKKGELQQKLRRARGSDRVDILDQIGRLRR